MSFDKTKAMRSAEKYVAQGKIRSAITEYKAVVDNDPRDISTLNMLGDLHAKSSNRREAVDCYMKVAEHYSTQGFSQKAIAVYNKISRLQPDSIEVSAKLAELYKVKGSLSEARSHYETLADHYEKSGRRIEALSMWKQIALLDPNNTEVCMSLGDSYIREGQRDEAAEAYSEAGARYSRLAKNEEAIRAFHKSLDIKPDDLRTLDGLVKAYSALGRVNKAVGHLEEILENEPYNRDVLYLLIDCHIDSQNVEGAEKAVLRLVEIEPANYPKLLDLVRMYLNTNDLDSATRILSMSSEYLFAGGQGEECRLWINEILERQPDHVAALRLLVRHASWVKEEESYRIALDRLATAANTAGQPEEERFALAQLVVIRPFEKKYSERLAELKEQYGYSDDDVDTELLKAEFEPEFVEPEHTMVDAEIVGSDFDMVPADSIEPDTMVERNGHFETAVAETEVSNKNEANNTVQAAQPEPQASLSSEEKLVKEVESIAFYIENEYFDLASRAITELEAEFGQRPEIDVLKRKLDGQNVEIVPEMPSAPASVSFGIEEMRQEFGLTESEPPSDEDYETKYHTAVAYQEMGLTDEAIRIYQEAINIIRPNDGTRRFFQCANLIGHCFVETGQPTFAVTWFKRALETVDLTSNERLGLWYELASALEMDGDHDEARQYFEKVYAEDVDFRDVASKLRAEVVAH